MLLSHVGSKTSRIEYPVHVQPADGRLRRRSVPWGRFDRAHVVLCFSSASSASASARAMRSRCVHVEPGRGKTAPRTTSAATPDSGDLSGAHATTTSPGRMGIAQSDGERAGRRPYGGREAERGVRERQRVGRSRGLARWQAPKPARRRPSASRDVRGRSARFGSATLRRRWRALGPHGKRDDRRTSDEGAVLCVSLARGPLRGESPVRLTNRLGDAIHALQLQQLARVEPRRPRRAPEIRAIGATMAASRRYWPLAQWRACVL